MGDVRSFEGDTMTLKSAFRGALWEAGWKDGMEIKCNDIMAIGDSGLITVGKDIKLTIIETIKKLVDDKSELISLYYGCDINEEDAETLKHEVEALYPDIDVELQFGGQPIYYYILSVE